MMGGAAMGWMWAWPVLVVAGLALLGYVGLRLVPGWPEASGAGSAARRILDERYARGEIDVEEYQRRKAGLS